MLRGGSWANGVRTGPGHLRYRRIGTAVGTAPSRSASRKPLFVVGTSRSGATFLHQLLNKHPDIRLSYESKLIVEGQHTYSRVKTATESGFHRMLDEFIRLDEAEPLNRWLVAGIDQHRKFLYEHPSFQALVEAIYQLPG